MNDLECIWTEVITKMLNIPRSEWKVFYHADLRQRSRWKELECSTSVA